MIPATLRSAAFAFAASLVLVLGWSTGMAAAQASPVVINLSAQNNSGLSGTATLTDIGGGKTRVELSMTGPEGDYPAHIHMGTCANLNPAPQYPLTNVRNGQSTTDVDASLATIEQSPHAINLHKSAEDIATYVACGDITTAAPNAAAVTTTSVTLSAQNNSGLSGTVSMTDLGNGKTRVQVNVTGPEGDYPAHIHMGTCANLNPAPQYPLTNVRNGQSTTDVDASLATIQQSPHAVNLHKSAEDIATYVACGDIAVAGSSTAPPSTTTTSPAPAQPAALANVPRARDGQSLATQTPATQAAFVAVWGDRAATEWVTEHEAALAR